MSDPSKNDVEDNMVFDIVSAHHRGMPCPKTEAPRPQPEQDEDFYMDPEWEEIEEEQRRDVRAAVRIGGFLCAVGSLFLIGAWKEDIALVAGGVFVAAGLVTIGVALAIQKWM